MDDSFGSALKYALKLLGYRDRSTSEMRRKLSGKGFPADIVEQTVFYLEEKAFIDDLKLAELLKRDAIERKHLGAQGVKRYLIRRGIERDVADAMSEPDDAYLQAAMQLAEKKISSMRGLDDGTMKRRLWGVLARRGFTPDEIGDVLKRLIANHKNMNEESGIRD
jgi:regulatory protein